MRRALCSLTAALAIALVAGCAEREGEDTALARAAIHEGSTDARDVAVVAVVLDEGGGFSGLCSGSLVAPNLVLTAHHCVAATTTGESVDCGQTRFLPPHPAKRLAVADLVHEPANPTLFDVVTEVLLADDTAFCGADLALLVLSEPIAGPTLTPRVHRAALRGERYAAVGFGAVDGDGDDSGTRRRRDDLDVACVGLACHDPGVVENEWMGGDGTCTGDSGGPALDDDGLVIGVTSRGRSGCASSVYGSVEAWSDFLVEGAAQAAVDTGSTLPAWAATGGDEASGCSTSGHGAADPASLGTLVLVAAALRRRRRRAAASATTA